MNQFESIEIPITEWLYFNTAGLSSDQKQEVKRKLFYAISVALKLVHEKGYNVSHLSFNSIKIDQYQNISFSNLVKSPSNDTMEVSANIEDCAFLAVSSFIDNYRFINKEYMRTNFGEFSNWIPSTDLPYFRGVIVNGDRVYYSEFRKALSKEYQKRLAQEVDEVGGRGKPLTKSTPYRIDLPEDNTVNKDAAFATNVILPAIVLITTLLGSILFFAMYFLK